MSRQKNFSVVNHLSPDQSPSTFPKHSFTFPKHLPKNALYIKEFLQNELQLRGIALLKKTRILNSPGIKQMPSSVKEGC
jgi:hypothetical protein